MYIQCLKHFESDPNRHDKKRIDWKLKETSIASIRLTA